MKVGDLVRILKQPLDLAAYCAAHGVEEIGKVVPIRNFSGNGNVKTSLWWYQPECYEPFQWKQGDKFQIHGKVYICASKMYIGERLCLGGLEVGGEPWNTQWYYADWCTFVQPNGETLSVPAPPPEPKKYRVINAKKEQHNEAT